MVLPGVPVIAWSEREESTKIAESKPVSQVQEQTPRVRNADICDDTRDVSKVPSLFLPLP